MFIFGVFLIPNGSFFAFADDCDNCEDCVSGGPGSTSCEISGTIMGVATSCKVECKADHYSCCKDDFNGLSCKCCEGS